MLKELQKNQRILTILCFLGIFVLLQYAFLTPGLDPARTVINYLLILPLFGLLLLVTRRSDLAFVILSLILYVVHYIDAAVYSARLTHLRYSDLFAVGDALRVADKYSFYFSKQQAILLAFILLADAAIVIAAKRMPEKQSTVGNTVAGGVTIVISLALLILGTAYGFLPDPMQSIDDNFDINGMVERDGLYYSLYGQYLHSGIKVPDGYSEERAQEIMNRYADREGNEEAARVIVIMNEALADYSLIGKTSFDDPLINIHDPENSYFEGKLAVSVFGGYTCNTEFEFLTGCSMRFFPQEYIPFTQLITSNLYSFAWDMKDLGMYTTGIHPYYSQEWNRRQVYQWLGFEQFIAGEEFSSGLSDESEIRNITDTKLKTLDFGADLEYIRGFISDAEGYRKTVETLDTRGSNSFVFLVTVQNHGGYDYEGSDFLSTEYIPGERELNQYLTCSAISDAAFQSFLDDLAEDSQKTVVLMFGDHQPGLDFSTYVNADEEDPFAIYYVPYVVWSNFEMEADLPAVTSANYLSAILKQCGGLPLTSWDQFRLDAMEQYPVMTGNFVLDADMSIVSEDEFGSGLLKEYAIVQYDRIKR